jgi:hypothetical protein
MPIGIFSRFGAFTQLPPADGKTKTQPEQDDGQWPAQNGRPEQARYADRQQGQGADAQRAAFGAAQYAALGQCCADGIGQAQACGRRAT